MTHYIVKECVDIQMIYHDLSPCDNGISPCALTDRSIKVSDGNYQFLLVDPWLVLDTVLVPFIIITCGKCSQDFKARIMT